MKLQIAFDLTDLDKALSIAHSISEQADILEIGSLLLYKYGEQAIVQFKQQFPNKTLLVDAKIVDRGKEAVELLAHAGADWITVMAGTGRSVIHSTCATAHELGKKVMLDLLDASSLGQSALEAKSLGVDAILFHKPADDDAQLTFLDRWDMVKGNTQLPVFVSAPVTRENIHEILAINPAGIVIGKTVTHLENPHDEIVYFKSLIS